MKNPDRNGFSTPLANILLSLVTLLALILLGEIVARVMKLDAGGQDRYLNPADRFFFTIPINERDPNLFWRLRPNARFGKLSTNARGFRGKDFDRVKPDNTVRIVVLGDSCTLGVGVGNEETYAAVLEDRLNRIPGSKTRYEVINAGVAGYTSLQGLRYLKSRIIRYRPDVIVAQFGFNDYLFTGGSADKDIPPAGRLSIKADELLGKSHFIRFLKNRIVRIGSGGTRYPPNVRVAPEDFGENLKGIASAAVKSGAKVVLMNLPVRPEIPLVVNPIPIPVEKNGVKLVEWMRPSLIGGKNYFTESDYDGPASDLENAVGKYPQWALAHYFLARKYELSGEREKALREYGLAKETDADRKSISAYNSVIARVAGETGVPLVDLVAAFGSAGGKNLFLDERHPNPEAHALIAERIREVLLSGPILPERVR